MEEDGGQMEAFLRWAANQGITDCPSQPLQSSQSSPLSFSLFISYFPEAGGRGLAAARELRKGELILRVPRHALLTSESVLSKDERLATAVKRHNHLSSTQVLAVCLLAEVGKGRASWWYPYLVQLPRIYSTLSTFTPFEIQALQVDDAIWASKKAVSKVQSDWEGASALMKELGLKHLLLTFRSWLWASATMRGLRNSLPLDDHKHLNSTLRINHESQLVISSMQLGSYNTAFSIELGLLMIEEEIWHDPFCDKSTLNYKIINNNAISSRALHIPWDDAGCLCPVGDFFNYAAPEEESLCAEDIESIEGASPMQIRSPCENKGATETLDAEEYGNYSQRLTDGGYGEDAAAYCFYARKRYKKGEQVLLCYGTYTNLELLEHYGFLLSANPNEKAFIQLDIDLSISNPWPRDSMYIQQDGKPSFALLSVLRLSAMDWKLRKAVGHLVYSGSVLSAENEISVLKWLVKECTSLLEDLPTSVEEDGLLLCKIDKLQNDPVHENVEKLAGEEEVCNFFQANGFKKGAVSDLQLPGKLKRSMGRWKLAVQWRFKYKQSITDCISYCTNMIECFSSQHASVKRTGQT